MSWEYEDELDELPESMERLEPRELESGWFIETSELEPGVISERIGCTKTAELGELNSDMVGEPEEDAKLWHFQQRSMSCAVVSQEFVAEGLLHKDFSEEKMVEFAKQHGWYEDGTSPEDAGKLLEAMGLTVEREYGASLEDLEQVLSGGGKAMVSVHNAVLANPEQSAVPWLSANHMLEVIGIDRSDAEHIKITVNDPGVRDGAVVACVEIYTQVTAWNERYRHIIEKFGLQ